MNEHERDVLELLQELYDVARDKRAPFVSTSIEVIADQLVISQEEARAALESLAARDKIVNHPETWGLA